MNEQQLEKAFCNGCSKETRHKIVKEVRKEDHNDSEERVEFYQILECGGCEHVTFRKYLWSSLYQEFFPNNTEPIYIQDTYFPPPLFRAKPRWLYSLDAPLSNVLEEVYVALQNNTRYLAAVGARTALDIVLGDKVKVNAQGSFQERLEALEKSGFVSQAQREMLEVITEAGNAAAHRGYALEKKDLVIVMDILESVIHKLYIAEGQEKKMLARAEELKKKVPPRKRPTP